MKIDINKDFEKAFPDDLWKGFTLKQIITFSDWNYYGGRHDSSTVEVHERSHRSQAVISPFL